MNQVVSLRLFDEPERKKEEIWVSPGAAILAGYALEQMPELFAGLRAVEAVSPFRHMVTRQGFEIHVETTGCGPLSWVSDRSGYRYDHIDPATGKPWPPMPQSFFDMARAAAAAAGYVDFTPDSCLINRYNPDTTSSLHRDGERDTSQPVVTISVGVSVSFLWGGNERTDKAKPHLLTHGDVMVFGGPSRLYFHGVKQLKGGETHPLTGERRYSITLRKAA
jgi:alkylated DNA repair protein (DNA oxidative demethylase)